MLKSFTDLTQGPLLVWCLKASALAALIGIIFLFIFYGIYLGSGNLNIFGPLNDIAVVIQYLLMLPLLFAFHERLKHKHSTMSLLSLIVGFIGMLGVIILQAMLILGLVPFAQQVGIVSIFFFITLAWFLINRSLDSEGGFLPSSLVLTVFAGLVFGYPLWAWNLASALRDDMS